MFKSVASLCVYALFSLFLVGCTSQNSDQAEPETLAISTVTAASQHYLEVRFNRALEPDEVTANDIEIVSGVGQKLSVRSLIVHDDQMGVTVETDTQDPLLYSLFIAAPAERSLARTVNNISYSAASDFIGSTGPEPFVMSVVALSNTEVLITFDRPMDPDYAELTSAYQILSPNGQIPNTEEGRISIVDASVDEDDERFITLTTTPLLNIEYALVVTNIITEPGHAMIHPDRNGGYFFGIAPTDTDAPLLLQAVSTGNTSLVASFSEPLWDTAATPDHYRVCDIPFDAQGVCPVDQQLPVISSELTSHNTQVAMITGQQDSGKIYYLLVEGVTDRATPAPGNFIAANTVAEFIGTGSGAPEVTSAIALDNTHVLLTFSERMSDDVLNPAAYRIESPPLDILNAIFGDDRWHVILTTTPQERREYQVAAGNLHSDEGRLMAYPATPVSFVGVADKDMQAPYLIAAIAETSSRVRLYFSEPMDDSAAVPAMYDISFCPEFQQCTLSTLSDLPVLSAELTASATQVVLTVENIAPRVEHQVVVNANVTDQAMPLPHNGMDPALSSDTFGLLLDDKENPGVDNITITSVNELTLTFSEEVNAGAANPLYYRVCTTPFDANGLCTGGTQVQVLNAELNDSHTQVKLTTEPLQDNTHYYVWVLDGVTDTTGNVINQNANQADIFYAGATSVTDPEALPKVVGAISVSNIGVIVSFSSVMGDSALVPQHYLFTQENVNGEVGTVFSMAANWTDETHTSVLVTTTSQNEVTYRVTVVNVKDVAGHPLATQEDTFNTNYDPTSATFAGSPPVAQMLTLVAGNWSWVDQDDSGTMNVGDSLMIDGISILLIDDDLDGNVDNWLDANSNGVIDEGDTLSGLIDSDADGLADNEELRGTTVVIELSDGQQIVREVTSDPTLKDTDADGISDLEEWSFGMDPRSPDTDSDGLRDNVEWNIVYSAPTDQDTDDDSLPDGLEHNFFLTSVLLADTDGDQINDDAELIELNRDPKVADLPKLEIRVGEINLQLDERYTYTDATGETIATDTSTSTSLSSSQNTSFANSTTAMSETVTGFNWDVGFGIRDAQADDDALGGNEITSWQNYVGSLFSRFYLEVGLAGSTETTNGTTVQIDRESALESQRALESTLARMNEQSRDSEVTRELVAARMSANVSLSNAGDLAMRVSNLQISVQQIDPQNPSKLIPITTLVAESTLMTGVDLEVVLGPFTGDKGPFVFTNLDAYPNLIEALMRDPTSLVFKVVNYDISDEYQRNFAFSNQTARDRTAGIRFDYGELGHDDFYVATNGVLDNGIYRGGFTETGKPKGIALGYLLESVLGIPKHDTSANYIDYGRDGDLDSVLAGDDVDDPVAKTVTVGVDGILQTRVAGGDLLRNPDILTGVIAGADKQVDSIAQGDDLQLVPYGTSGVAPKTLVIDPGSNGVLESIIWGDDQQEFISGYELQNTCSADSALTSKIGEFCTVSDGDCACDGPQGLVRMKSLRNGDYSSTWIARLYGETPASVDFDQIQLKAGEDIQLAFLQDLDHDGLFAHEEFLYGSIDSSANIYNNANFKPIVDPATQRAALPTLDDWLSGGADEFMDSMDTDRDGIGDLAEVKLGWVIQVDGKLQRVFSSPASVDSDSDGLWDIQEQDLSGFCAGSDPRTDSLCADRSVNQNEATGIIVGANGRLDTQVSGDDEYVYISPDQGLNVPINQGLMFGTVAILPGDNGIIDTLIEPNVSDDRYVNASIVLPATDPMAQDTDSDKISDGDEVFGFASAMSIIEGAETECYGANCSPTWGLADTQAQGDDWQRVFDGSRTQLGEVIITAGANGILETVPEGNDAYVAGWFIAAGPDRVRNCLPGAGDVASYQDASQTLAPYAPALWNNSGTPTPTNGLSCLATSLDAWQPGQDLRMPGLVVVTDPLRRDTDHDLIIDGVEIALGANPTVEDGADFRDIDYDGLSDAQEADGWLIEVNGGLAKLVRSSGVNPDSDFDGLPDFVERDIASNPNKADTDGDGLGDYDEFLSLVREQANGVERQYSIYDYTQHEALFSGFNLVLNPDAYGTDPALADTDGDSLSDYAELVTGYTLTLPGSTETQTIFTDALNTDTDGDGLLDNEETEGVLTPSGQLVQTNAASVDTDGDGTFDDAEVASDSLSNVLVKDATVLVNYDSVFIANLDECALGGGLNDENCPTETNVLWWLYADGNDGELGGRHLLSASDEFAYVPDGSVIPHASGHAELASDTVLNELAGGEQPTSVSSDVGLLMEVRECIQDGWFDEDAGNNCEPYFIIEAGDTGWTPNAFFNWGGGGFEGLTDHFIVRWSGQIYIAEEGNYEFFVVSDDGSYLEIDGSSTLNYLDGNLSTDEEIWSDHNTQVAHGVADNLSVGWHQIKIKMYENGGDADIVVKYGLEGVTYDTATPLLFPYLKHTSGNGSFACVGIERQTDQSSFISLNRNVGLENNVLTASVYSPDLPYYGSVDGSELKVFQTVVAADTGLVNNNPTDHPAYSRYYLDLPNGSNTPENVQRRASVAIDLSASRSVISNMVKPDVENNTIVEGASIQRDLDDNRYYPLSDAGRKLYRQLANAQNQMFGNKRFVVREGESFVLSGTLMKVDTLEDLTSCPIGDAGVVSQFSSGCMKRFSRTLSYNDVRQQPYMQLNLNDLQAQTFSSSASGAAGCEMDITANISLQ